MPTITAHVHDRMQSIDAAAWNRLWHAAPHATPFMRHEYLLALEESGSVGPDTGWQPCHVTLQRDGALVAACPLYLKTHSYGEYVFDFAWARAYAEHGLAYYPKAVVAVPFTPVPGSRLLAEDDELRGQLLRAALQFCESQGISSLHLLFGSAADLQTAEAAGLMQRQTVQFHWSNRHVHGAAAPYRDFDDFLAELQQDKRKKIRQERRKVAEAGVRFRHARGQDISAADWQFFYQCYERTYLEHGNPPYLTPAFFEAMAAHMAGNWLLFVAERDGRPIASSLTALDEDSAAPAAATAATAYGRYWGALERVDCLHFEACYYQPLEWCIAQGFGRFEGGAQGEHKMARALLPTVTPSAHWLAHPGFAEAVERFLDREGDGMQHYLQTLQQATPFKHGA
ncbi:MAG: GNAT family N-acetyltransferase [Comamonas sp.]